MAIALSARAERWVTGKGSSVTTSMSQGSAVTGPFWTPEGLVSQRCPQNPWPDHADSHARTADVRNLRTTPGAPRYATKTAIARQRRLTRPACVPT